MDLDNQEQRRLSLQTYLDSRKSQDERNRLGQFATPEKLANDMVRIGITLLDSFSKIKFIDPAFGTGVFYSALRRNTDRNKIDVAYGFEIDPHYGIPARQLWSSSDIIIKLNDFTKEKLPGEEDSRFNFLVCNPPYVRHHHLSSDDKVRLQHVVKQSCGIRIYGLTGLYCYFLLLAHKWLQEGGVGVWLIPSEFMDVNYGREIKYYLTNKVKVIRIHRFTPSDVQFDKALVSSTVIWFHKEIPNRNHQIEFTFGNSVDNPDISRKIPIELLKNEGKWTRFPVSDVAKKKFRYKLSDMFIIKRGIATGDNKFFILSKQDAIKHKIPKECIKPILPSPRYLKQNEVFSDEDGFPVLENQYFLLDCELPEHKVKAEYPELWNYLKTGKDKVANRYICRNRRVWYFQEKRPPAKILCTYIGRNTSQNGGPFRFILNHSQAIAPNVYLLLYPKPFLSQKLLYDSELLRKIWLFLNSIPSEAIIEEGRVYGGGLHKLEPKELGNVDASYLLDNIPDLRNSIDTPEQTEFNLSL